MIDKKISIIVPCYNEEENISEMYQRVTKVLKSLAKNYELIFINNGSTDNSENEFKKIAKKDSNVTVINYSRNFGPHGAYAGGLDYCSGDAVICIDGDLQDPPELIPKLVKKWLEGYDVVYGIRTKRQGNIMRKMLTILYYRILNKLSYVHIPLDAGDFALMDKKVASHLNKMPEHSKYFTGLRAWVGFRQIGVEFVRQDRHAGKTKFSMLDYIRWAMQSIFSFSYKPLELISYLAIFVVFLTAIGILIYILDFFFYPNNPRGFITLIIVILFLGGIQLLCLSIIGQYLLNIFEETKNRPNFIIEDILNDKKAKNK